MSKLLMKFAHVIDVAKATLGRMDLEAANVLIGCETLAVVPEEIQAVIGHRVYNINKSHHSYEHTSAW